MIYLDNAATTFPKPESVYVAMDKANRELGVNAGRGAYKKAREASALISETKTLLRNLVNADASVSVVFSPSVTIALNQIINGIDWSNKKTVYMSPYEHNAVARTIYKVSKEFNFEIKQLPLDLDSKEIDLERVKYEFAKSKPDAVFCTHVSNVTGYILPIEQIFSEAKKFDCVTVLDTAQSLGLIKIDCKRINADVIAFAGHKTLYGPFGIGGFINYGRVKLSEVVTGGTGSDSLNLEMPSGPETKYEASSKNIVAVAGLNAALKCLDLDENYKHEKKMTDYFLSALENIQGIKVYLPKDREKHIGVVSFTYDGFSSEEVGEILDDEYDIAVRTGYHCAPFISKYLNTEKSLGTVRVGLSQFTTKEEIDKLSEAIESLAE